MMLHLEVPGWMARELEHRLTEEIRSVGGRALTEADLYRVERHREEVALVLGQLLTAREHQEHQWNKSIEDVVRKNDPEGGDVG